MGSSLRSNQLLRLMLGVSQSSEVDVICRDGDIFESIFSMLTIVHYHHSRRTRPYARCTSGVSVKCLFFVTNLKLELEQC